MMYCTFSGIYAALLSLKPYVWCERTDPLLRSTAIQEACTSFGIHFSLMFMISCFVALVIGMFWLWMAWMAWHGQTMNEFFNIYIWKTKQSEEYRRFYGTPRRNLESFFGPMRWWWRWLLPCNAIPSLPDDTPL